MKTTMVAILIGLLMSGCADQGKATIGHTLDYPDLITSVDEAGEISNPFHPIKLLLSKDQSAGAVTFYEFILPPESAGSPPHTHALEDEYFFVTSGTLDVMSGNKIMKLKAGGFASLNRGHTHMFWNSGLESVTLIMATTGGTFEEFIAGVAPTMAEEKPANAQEAGAIVGRLAAEHGIEISMEKMPKDAAKFYQ